MDDTARCERKRSSELKAGPGNGEFILWEIPMECPAAEASGIHGIESWVKITLDI